MFYKLKITSDKSGNFARRESYLPYEWDASNAQGELQYDEFPNFEPNFSILTLTKDSKLVDFVTDGGTIGGNGLLISKKVKDILSNYQLPPHRYYPLTLFDNDEIKDGLYFWLQILVVDNYHWIDFSRSKFSLKAIDDFDIAFVGKPVDVKNATELREIIERNSDSYLMFSKITLNENYNKNPMGLFYFDRIGGVTSTEPIINYRLKNEFEQENISGYKVLQLDIISD